ncbi:carboxypeptidase regulatory-like domain-containing protein [Halorhabdus rudnickae]|uniref:carboxypeptidase regulatory-like domain-containing protein n=1 Tax=Halorhabdus rudnickae TaxID=1775544 RepID=UPI001084925B|nr:carboxypeptidase regulatory-like domain-containing protein [Halorhabdus rudnickae]
MTGNSTPYEKARAAFLATLMVLSVFAGVVAISGSAAAAANSVSLDNDPVAEGDAVSGTVVVDSGSPDLHVWIDTDDSGTFNSGEPNTTIANGQFSAGDNVPFSGLDTTGLSAGSYDVAAAQSSSLTSGSTAEAATASVEVQTVVVTNVDAPRVAPNATGVTVEVTVENVGSSAQNTDISFLADGTESNVLGDSATTTVASQMNTSLAGGASTTLTFTPNTYDDYLNAGISANTDTYHGVYLADNISGDKQDAAATEFYVSGQSTEGAVTAEVRNTQGFPIDNANTTLYVGSVDSTNVVATGVADGGPNDNRIRYEDLAVGTSGSPVEYIVVANKDRFQADNRAAELTVNNNEETVFPELQSNLDAQHLEIVRVNDNGQPVDSDQGSLLADGESENTQTFAVVTQNQANDGISGTLDVSLDISGDAYDLTGGTHGVSVGDFIDNETLDRGTSVTINGSDTWQLDSDYDKVSAGTVSYATFEVTADNATRDRLESNNLDPIADQPLTASAQNETSPLTDSGNVTYFLKGDKATQHQVVGTDSEPIENATVWVAYQNASQNLDAAESITDLSGDAFLVDETNENGMAVIDGIIGSADSDSPRFNVYVQKDDYDVFNSSEATLSNGNTLSAQTGLAGDTYVADFDVNNTIAGDEGSGEDDVYSHVLYETAQAYDLNVTVADAEGDFVKSTTLPDTESRQVQIEVASGEVGQDPADFTSAANEEIDLELIRDSGVANLVNTTVETNSNGVAYTAIEGVETQTGIVNITASITNSENTQYRTDGSTDSINAIADQAEVELVTTGNIEGDVIDANQEQVPGATIELQIENSTGAFVSFENRSVTTGTDGSFTFQNVPTGEDYRVVATFVDADGNEYTGFNEGQLENLVSGTTTAGISLQELELDDVPTDWYTGYVDSNDVVGDDGLNDAVNDYLNDDLSDDQINDVIASYLNDAPITDYMG